VERGIHTIGDVVEVNIGISETSTGHGITTDSDTGDGADTVEQLKEHSLRDTGIEFANIQ
jgi:hypothetical protein